jgi:thioredoxin reductase
MHDVLVVGGGPAGLQTALFTAKNGLDTLVFDTKETAMNKAYLENYLGVRDTEGPDFMETAREQVEDHGAEIQYKEAVGVEQTMDGFAVTTDDRGHEETHEGTYLVLATGYARDLAEELGCEFETINDTEVVRVDRNNETTVTNAYAAGWTVRPDKIQAAISVGTGAAAGLDVLSKEKGEAFHDFDTI